MGAGFAKEEALMHCVICKRGTVKSGIVQAELRVGTDHLMVPVETEVCDECGEAYYSAETMRHLEQVRENFLRKLIAPPSVGHVYQIS
jgi:YgiT-type zinc finger domain-containing protein